MKFSRTKSRLLSLLLIVALSLFTSHSVIAADLTPVKVGVLKFGTVNWELKALKHAGFDHQNGIDLEIVPFAGGDATKIALQGGAVDIIVSDWLWVSRQRAEGVPLTFAPYSSSVGSLMVAGNSTVKTLADVKGLKIGVAGGPLDKSWLLLQGMAKQDHDFDLAAENEIVFGAPPLLAEKTKQGELDAMLNFWHYCARLEAEGYRRVISAEDAAIALGASGPISSIGYVFDEQWASQNPAAEAFIKASRQTKALLKKSDEEWQRLKDTGAIKDGPDALAVLRDRFREGIPVRDIDEEIVDAAIVYSVLEGLGGAKLVGDSKVMAEGTYWDSKVY